MTYHPDRRTLLTTGAAAAGLACLPRAARAQEARELVIVSFAGSLQEPHQWLARRMEASHPGLKIRLVPSESQDIVAQIKAAQGYSPYDAMPNGEPPHLIGIARGLHPEGQAGEDPELRQRVPGVRRERARATACRRAIR